MIVMGASLGGTAALRRVLGSLPAGFPDAIAVVLHRHRDSDDGLVTLLQGGCACPVREAVDKEPLAPGAVLIAPADYHLLVEPTYASLSVDEAVQYARPSIDVLFESAADSFGARAIGVILTGGNHDGARGAAAIRTRGGRVIVQDPADAECPIMPEAAIAVAGADCIAALDAVGPTLAYWLSKQANVL